MNDRGEGKSLRAKIAVRFLYTILYLILFEIVKFFIQASTIFQFIYLFITQKPCDPLLKFSNKASSYGYQIMRYVTLNSGFPALPLGRLSGGDGPTRATRALRLRDPGSPRANKRLVKGVRDGRIPCPPPQTG